MAFFDEIDELEELLDSESEAEYGNSLLSNIGDVVYYDPISYQFMLASAFDMSKINANRLDEWQTIMIGVVINQYEDYSVDVLMGGFLMADPLHLPIMYYRSAKQKYIRNYVKNMFTRYVRAFFKKCPAYEDLLKLDIEMPSVADMLKIHQNRNTIFSSLRICTDEKKYVEYIDRLYNSYIYVTHNNKIYQMQLGKNEDGEPDIIYPEARLADFMCVFRKIKIYNLTDNETKS